MTGLPLDEITVVGPEQAVAAPFATRQLAELGARVIKVERPDGGDFARGYDVVMGGEARRWLQTPTPGGAVRTLRPPGAPCDRVATAGAVPSLGAHTAAVLAEPEEEA